MDKACVDTETGILYVFGQAFSLTLDQEEGIWSRTRCTENAADHPGTGFCFDDETSTWKRWERNDGR